MNALCPCHSSTPKSLSQSSVIVYQGMCSHPWRSFNFWSSACGAREANASVTSRAFRWAGWDLVRDEGAAHARPLGVRVATLRVRVGGDLRPVEGAVDDQLTAALEQVGKRGRPVRALEAVLLLDRHPRHPAALGRERVTGSGVLLLLDEQFLAGGLPLLGGDDGGCVHFAPSSFRHSSTTSMKRPQTARWRSIHSATSQSTSSSSDRTCVRPSTACVTTPVSSSTFTCLVIAGLDTPKPAVASLTVAGPAPSRSRLSTPRAVVCDTRASS